MKEIEIYKQELALVYEINDKIHMNMDLNNILEKIISIIILHMEIDFCNIGIIEDEFYMRLHNVLPTQFLEYPLHVREFVKNAFYSKKIYYKESPIWMCMAANFDQEIYCPDIDLKELTSKEEKYFKLTNTRGIYIIPIKLENKVIGSMMLRTIDRTLYLTKQQKNVLRKRASLLARVLDNYNLYEQMKVKKMEYETDLIMASKVQNNLIPHQTPHIQGVKIASSYIPMQYVGGDYFDFIISKDQTQVGLIICDVTGHGLSAAVITSMVKMVFKSKDILDVMDSPHKVLSYINKSLFDKLAGNFITANYTVFNIKKSQLISSNAGHHPFFVINKKNGKMKKIISKGKFLGFEKKQEFEEISFSIKPNHRYFYYTDGLIEAKNKNDEDFEHILIQILQSTHKLNENKLIKLIESELKKHAINNEKKFLNDDIAMIALDTNGRKK